MSSAPLPRSLETRVLLATALAVLCFVGALAVGEVALFRIGAALQVVDVAYLPLGQLAARMSAEVDPPAASRPPGASTVDGRAPGRALREGAGPLPPQKSEVAAADHGADWSALLASVAEGRAIVARAQALEPDAEESASLQAILLQLDDIAAAAETTREGHEPRTSVRNEVLQLARLLDTRVAAVSERTASAHRRAERVGLVWIVAGVLVGTALLVSTRSALRPIRDLTEQAGRVATGERVEPLASAGRNDEIGQLAAAFDRMVTAVDERDRNLQALTLYLRRVLDAIGLAVVVAEDGRVRMVNAAARALWRVEVDDALPAWLAGLPEGRWIERPVEDGVQDVHVVPFDTASVARGGDPGEGGARGRLLVGEDVSQRVSDRTRLARSERLALVGQLLAQVTHEVRNPLNAMSLNAEMLSEENLGSEGRVLLDTITAEIRRLEDVTGRYLDLAGRRTVERVAVDPVALARSVTVLSEPALRRNGVSVEVRGESRVHEVPADILRRALLNLVKNAAEAGARTVRVVVSDTASTVRVVVEDDGPGMAPEVAAQAFEPFYTTRSRGTGLGLAIVRQELDEVGGHIEVVTSPGAGARFEIVLTECPTV